MTFRAAVLVLVALAWPLRAAAEEPLTLRQAVSEALRASPSLRIPEDGRTLAAIQERQANAQFGLRLTPQVQTGTGPASYNQQSVGLGVAKRLPLGTTVGFDVNRYEFGSDANAFHDAGYTFNVSQPLLRGWTVVSRAGLDVARRASVSSERAYTDARQQLVVSVADAYFAVVRASRLVGIAERAADRASRLRVSSEARAGVGLATQLDVLRADLLLSQSEAELADQQERLATAGDQLNTLIGRSVDAPIDVSEEYFDDIDAVPDHPVERFIQTALAARVDAHEARDRVLDARRNERIAKWNLLPPINLDVSYVKRGLGAGDDVFYRQMFNGWRAGLSFGYALDRSSEQAAAAIASVSIRAAERQAQDTERTIVDDVRRAYRTRARTATTIGIQKKAVDLAERQLRLAQLRYTTGVAGNFDVIDAETNLLHAQSMLVGAQVEQALATLSLQRVSGTLDPSSYER